MSTIKEAMMMPVSPGERIQILDILRGFALLGILLVNMDLFSNPMQMIVLPPEAITGVDRAACLPLSGRQAKWQKYLVTDYGSRTKVVQR